MKNSKNKPPVGARHASPLRIVAIALVLILATASLLFVFNTDLRLRWLYNRIEANAERGNWDAVLRHSERYLHLAEASGIFSPTVVDNTKFALVKTGRLLNEFFAFSRFEGFGILFSQDFPASEFRHPGAIRFLYDMGMDTDLGIGLVNLDNRVLRHWLANPQNQRAGEYVVMMGLSAKLHQNVMREILFLLENFDYAYIPRHMEEAIIAHIVSTAPERGIEARGYLRTQTFGGLPIRLETIVHADDFFDWVDRLNAREILFSELRHRFGDTYWFHVLFMEVPVPGRGN